MATAADRFASPDTTSANWLKWATDTLSNVQEDYEEFQDYYDGEHELAFRTDKWDETFGTEFEEFADNWCQVVVDAVSQRLSILGWAWDKNQTGLYAPGSGGKLAVVGDDGSEDSDEGDDGENWAKLAEDIWDSNNGGLEEDDVHTQALVKGDSYVMVWEEEGECRFYYNDAQEVVVFYDPANPRRIAHGAKRFKDLDGTIHLYLYFPDRIEKWAIPSNVTEDQFAAMQMNLIDDEDAARLGFVREGPDVPNDLGEVPIVHFKNRGRGSTHGLSELKSIIPIQNAVNKLLMDMMVASEFGSFRMKTVAGGAAPKRGWGVGGDRVWHSTDANTRFGEFGQVDLEPIFKAVEVLVAHMAKISQTPMHYLRTSGDMPSGEAMKTAESGLIKKVEDRQKHWGASWAQVMRLAFKLKGYEDPPIVRPKWRPAETRHDLEQAQTAQLKSILGIPLTQLWGEHFGYSEEQIEAFEEKNKALAAGVLARVIAQVGQLPPGSEQVTATPQQLMELLKADNTVGNEGEGEGLDVSQILALLPKSVTAQSSAGEATAKPQPNTSPPASPTRRSTGFKD